MEKIKKIKEKGYDGNIKFLITFNHYNLQNKLISENPSKGFENSITNRSKNYRQCRCGNCPQMFSYLLLCASRQSGKTYSLVKPLQHYAENDMIDNDGKKHQITTILILPNVEANPVFQSLTSINFDEDVYDNYTDDLLSNIMDDIKSEKELENFKEYIKHINYQ